MKDPSGLVPLGESGSLASCPSHSWEPLLQSGQARLGANEYLDQAFVANEPYAPVGQADWGQGKLVKQTTKGNHGRM